MSARIADSMRARRASETCSGRWIARDLFDAMRLMGGRLRGAVAVRAIILAALSGIIGGEVVLLGQIALPQMLRQGHDRRPAISIICAGGPPGTMVPPSVVPIIYGLTASVPIGDLFTGAFLPGLMLAGFHVADALIHRRLDPSAATEPDSHPANAEVIRPFSARLRQGRGCRVLTGNLFDAEIMKIATITPEFRARHLWDPASREAFEGRAGVFDGPGEFHERIDDPALAVDAGVILVMRGTGRIGHPGAAEVADMRAPDHLLRQGGSERPSSGNRRPAGSTGLSWILNASPEAAADGGLALLCTGDRLRVGLDRGRVDALVLETEWAARRTALEDAGGFYFPPSQTPWQEMQRGCVDQLAHGMVLKPAVACQRIAAKVPPRNNH